MVTDPIADFLTRIRNAQMAGHRVVDIPASNLKKRMTEILYNQGYILKSAHGTHQSSRSSSVCEAR
jgi:small subunit ribosomal protein S8